MTLRISAIKVGFGLVLRSSKSGHQLDKHHLTYLNLQCQHGIRFHKRQITTKEITKLGTSSTANIYIYSE